MLKLTAVLAIAAASVLSTGCDDNDDDPDTVIGPAALTQTLNSTSDRPFVSADPLTLTSQLVGFGPPCPAVGPFRADFNVLVRAGNIGVVLTGVNVRFTDSRGITAPQVTMPAPAPTTQFGTALVQARSTRLFPFDFRFGCGTSRSGTIVVFVGTRDERGQNLTNEVRLTVK